MDNEATMLLNNEPPVYNGSNKPEHNEAEREKKSAAGPKIAGAAAAGIVLGVAGGAAGSAFAAQPNDELSPEQTSEENSTADHEAGNGVHYADVDDAGSFKEAFANARAELGPGGAFEYHGRLYSTYYAEEWNAMTPEDRAQHQHDIIDGAHGHYTAPEASDAEGVTTYELSAEGGTVHHDPITVNVIVNTGTEPSSNDVIDPLIDSGDDLAMDSDIIPGEDIPVDADLEAGVDLVVDTVESPGATLAVESAPDLMAEIADSEIRVIGVDVVQDTDGNLMNVALLDNGGDQAMLVDVDFDSSYDVMLHDDNGDGTLQHNEMYDISDAGLTVDDMTQMQADPKNNVYLASDDGMPDCVNDADPIMMA